MKMSHHCFRQRSFIVPTHIRVSYVQKGVCVFKTNFVIFIFHALGVESRMLNCRSNDINMYEKSVKILKKQIDKWKFPQRSFSLVFPCSVKLSFCNLHPSQSRSFIRRRINSPNLSFLLQKKFHWVFFRIRNQVFLTRVCVFVF